MHGPGPSLLSRLNIVSHDSVSSSELKHSFASALFVDLRRRAGAAENGLFGHSAHRYTRRIAFSGGQRAQLRRSCPGRAVLRVPDVPTLGSSAFPRPWGVWGPNIWRNIAYGGTIQIRTQWHRGEVCTQHRPERSVLYPNPILQPNLSSTKLHFYNFVVNAQKNF